MNRYLLKIAFLLLLLGSGCMASAQTQLLVVWMKNGERVLYDLEEQPKTTFADAELVITTSSVSASYPLSQVLRYTYELSASGVESVKENDIRISQKGSDLIFEHLKPDAIIRVYSLDGVLFDTKRAVGEQRTTVSLNDHPAGVYLITVGNMTYKMVKR